MRTLGSDASSRSGELYRSTQGIIGRGRSKTTKELIEEDSHEESDEDYANGGPLNSQPRQNGAKRQGLPTQMLKKAPIVR